MAIASRPGVIGERWLDALVPNRGKPCGFIKMLVQSLDERRGQERCDAAWATG